MAITYSAQKINKEICELYNLEEFNCLAALFGWGYNEKSIYAIDITAEKIARLKEFEAEFFETYVNHCRMIYEYFWNKGYHNVTVYIKSEGVN